MGDLLHDLGHRIRESRASRGWTQRELAARSGLSTRFVGQLEAGAANVSVRNLAQLAESLETTPDRLLRAPRRIVALVGLRGAGKSSAGRLLAERRGVPFFELDREVEERAGMSLAEIFDLQGDAYFRQLELEVLRELLSRTDLRAKGAVIATGGGLVGDPSSFALLKDRAVTVWLRARADEHYARVVAQGDRRPMAGRENALAELERLLAAREPFYAECELAVDTSRCGDAAATAAAIARALDEE